MARRLEQRIEEVDLAISNAVATSYLRPVETSRANFAVYVAELTKGCNAAMLLCMATKFVTVQKRGLINLPAEIRERHHLNDPGTQVEVAERDDGVIELRPKVPVRADQHWFWTNRWQSMEREADADIEAGRVERFDTAEDFIADLDADD